jgi:hypothetical protein
MLALMQSVGKADGRVVGVGPVIVVFDVIV